MWTLVLLPGVKCQDYIKLHVPLQSLPASNFLIIFMSVAQSSEIRCFYQNYNIWQDQRRARLYLENSWTTISVWNLTGTVSSCHRPFLTSTHFDIQHRADSKPLSCDNSKNRSFKITCVNYEDDMHDIRKKKKRQQRRHVNIIWPPVWLLAYLISSSQRKGLPLQHAKTSRKGRESSHQSKKTHGNNAAIAMSGLDMLKIY